MISFNRAVLKIKSRSRGGLPRSIFVPLPRGAAVRPSSLASFISSLISSTVPGSATKEGATPSTMSSSVASRACSSPTIFCRSSKDTFLVLVSTVVSLEVLGQAGPLDRVHAEGAGTFAAETRGREDLARVAEAMRIEGASEELHGLHILVGEHLGHVLLLVHADAVLARQGAAVIQAREDYIPGQALGLLGLAGVVVVVEDQRVEVAVASVEDVRDAHTVLLAELADPLEYVPEFRARDDRVLHVVVVGDPAHRRERGLSTLPKERPFGVVLGYPDLGGLGLLTDLYDLIELVRDLRLRPVELDDEDRGGLREARVDRGLDRLDAQGVHHLYRGRHDAAPDDPRDGIPGLLRVLEGREQGPDRLRRAQEAQGDLGRYPKRSLGAHKRPQKLIARGVGRLAATDMDHRAIGEDYLGTHHVVRGESVFQAVDAAGVLGEVTADGGDDLARGIWG